MRRRRISLEIPLGAADYAYIEVPANLSEYEASRLADLLRGAFVEGARFAHEVTQGLGALPVNVAEREAARRYGTPDSAAAVDVRGLTFAELRAANIARRDELLRAKRPDFRKEDEWSLNDWLTALVGEVGEAANLLKKVHRGDFTLGDVRSHLADELADVQTYLDLLAYAADIDLGAATADKWNRVSERINYPARLNGSPLSHPLAQQGEQ